MNEQQKELWKTFKSLVKEMRKRNDELIKERGSNQIMLAITLMDHSINTWIKLNPYSIDLRTGKAQNVLILGKYHKEVDVKYLLFNVERRTNDV